MQQEVEQNKDDVVQIDIIRIAQKVLQMLKKLWLIVLLAIAFCVATVVLVQQKSYTPSYKAYCTFSVHVINKGTLSDINSLYAVYYDQDLAEQLDATFSYLINSDLLLDDIKEYLGTDRIDGSIHANSIEGSNIFVISTYGSNPETAGKLLEALMAVYYDSARYVVGDMKTEIIEGPVVSQTPYNVPNRIKGVILGVGLGLVLSIGAMVLYAMFKRTVIKPSDLEEYINIPCFGVVPLVQTKRELTDDLAKVSATHEQGMFRESIRGIARKLENAADGWNKKVFLVTSTIPNEGKSMLSQNLAETFAHWGKKVVLIDGDLRNPSLYRRYGFKNKEFHLEDVLRKKVSADTVICRRHSGKLTLVMNSVPVEKSTVYIDSSAMKSLIEYFSAHAEIVIIDTPPCGQLSDVSLYQQYADGILYVIQQDQPSIRNIVDSVEKLCGFENKVVGYVINGAEQISQGYGKYGYGKYSYGKYGNYGGYGKYGYIKSGEYGNSGGAEQ